MASRICNGNMVLAAREEDNLHSLCGEVVRLVLDLKNLPELNQQNPWLVDVGLQNYGVDVLPFMLGDYEVARCGTPPTKTNRRRIGDTSHAASSEGLWACKWQRHSDPTASLSFDTCGV